MDYSNPGRSRNGTINWFVRCHGVGMSIIHRLNNQTSRIYQLKSNEHGSMLHRQKRNYENGACCVQRVTNHLKIVRNVGNITRSITESVTESWFHKRNAVHCFTKQKHLTWNHTLVNGLKSRRFRQSSNVDALIQPLNIRSTELS